MSTLYQLRMHSNLSSTFFSSSDLSSVLQPESANQSTTPRTFYSLKDKLLHLLFSAIKCETDSNNVQLLLHALMVFVCDIGQYCSVLNHALLYYWPVMISKACCKGTQCRIYFMGAWMFYPSWVNLEINPAKPCLTFSKILLTSADLKRRLWNYHIIITLSQPGYIIQITWILCYHGTIFMICSLVTSLSLRNLQLLCVCMYVCTLYVCVGGGVWKWWES